MKALGFITMIVITFLLLATDILNYGNIDANLVLYVLVYGFLIVEGSYLIYVFFKYDKEYSVSLDSDNIPINYKPFQIEYLLRKRITKYSLASVLLDLIRIEALLVKEVFTKSGVEYIIYNNVYYDNDQLSKTEKAVKKLFLKTVGNGELFTFGSLKNLLKSRKQTIYFYNSYLSFKEVAEMECFSTSIYETKPSSVTNRSIWLLVFSVVISILTFKYKMKFLLGNYLFVFAIVLFIYILNFRKKTKKTNEDYHKWTIFKRKLEGINYTKLLDTYNDMLEQYLIYGTVFNKTNLVEKRLSQKESNTTLATLSSKKFATHLVYEIVKLIDISRISKFFPTEIYGIGKTNDDPEIMKEIKNISSNK